MSHDILEFCVQQLRHAVSSLGTKISTVLRLGASQNAKSYRRRLMVTSVDVPRIQMYSWALILLLRKPKRRSGAMMGLWECWGDNYRAHLWARQQLIRVHFSILHLSSISFYKTQMEWAKLRHPRTEYDTLPLCIHQKYPGEVPSAWIWQVRIRLLQITD